MESHAPTIYWKDGAESIIVIKNKFSHCCSIFHPEKFLEKDSIVLQQNSITVFGRQHLEPRLTAWMGPRYRYSNIQWHEKEITPTVQSMLDELNKQYAFSFNAVLFNYYRNGQDSMGKHKDNEPEIDPYMIASVSFGASRLLRFTAPSLSKKIDVSLDHGDLMIMINMQERWYHELPKRKGIQHARLNLTFRKILV
jgi:alkylated DNA repair dioxygenase AlkB